MTDKSSIWFPAKRYGFGWDTPCTWQGWVVLGGYVGLVFLASVIIDPAAHLRVWVAAVVGLSVALCLVCWWKGEKPRWRWGDRT